MREQIDIVPQAKKWTQPQLTILTRAKDEESVLNACKNDGAGVNTPGLNYYACRGEPPQGCAVCSQASTS